MQIKMADFKLSLSKFTDSLSLRLTQFGDTPDLAGIKYQFYLGLKRK